MPEEGQGVPWHLEIERSMRNAAKEGVLRLRRQQITSNNVDRPLPLAAKGRLAQPNLKPQPRTNRPEELPTKDRTPTMVLFGSSRPVIIVRGDGTPLEQRWDTQIGGDFNQKALLPPETTFAVNDEIRGECFDESRIIIGFGPVVVRTGLSHWRAEIVPQSEWKHRRAHQRDLVTKAAAGRPFPKPMFHATNPPTTVYSSQQQNELGQEWSEEYIYQPYPKCKYHWVHKERTVKNLEEELALRDDWGDSPNEFTPYRVMPRVRAPAHDPTRWVDDWAVVGLDAGLRDRVKAQLLKADAAFWEMPDNALADRTSMKLAFDGIAKVLSEARLLTQQLLQNEIPNLVWDSSIAGGWYRFASEFPEGIFPEPLGHYWVWRDEGTDWNALFRAEQARWHAELLEGGVPSSRPSLTGARPRRRDPGIQQIKRRVRQLRSEGLSDKDICGRLGDSPRPPRAAWRDCTWPVAYQRHTPAVAKWLSEACASAVS